MLPVIVDDDFDEGPPEEHADEAGLADSPLNDLDIGIADPDSAMTHARSTQTNAEGTTALDEGCSASAGAVPLSEKEARKAEKAQAAAAKLCSVCGERADAKWLTCSCAVRTHVECLAKRFLQVNVHFFQSRGY